MVTKTKSLMMKNDTSTQYPSITQVSDIQLVNIVKNIFCTINPEYDFLNHLLSLGRDIAWRRFAVSKMRSRLIDSWMWSRALVTSQ